MWPDIINLIVGNVTFIILVSMKLRPCLFLGRTVGGVQNSPGNGVQN